MKKPELTAITYRPMSLFASDNIRYATPEGEIFLIKNLKIFVPKKALEWLKENSTEFNQAFSSQIIVESDDTPEFEEDIEDENIDQTIIGTSNSPVTDTPPLPPTSTSSRRKTT